jgi:hypothetical protein
MTRSKEIPGYPAGAVLALLLVLYAGALQAATPRQLLEQLDAYPHSRSIDRVEENVLDYEVGLGAIQKIRGAWRFKHSERFNGTLVRYTWQIVDGFTSLEVMAELVSRAEQLTGSDLLFACEGRACGEEVQWANRVFNQPLLYGRSDLQRYRVYAFGTEPGSLLIVYAAARTTDRQYLHAEVLEITP